MGPIQAFCPFRRSAHSGVLKEHRIRVDWPRVCHSGICGVPSERLHYRIAIPGVSPRAGIRRPVGALRRSVFPDPVGGALSLWHEPVQPEPGAGTMPAPAVIVNVFGKVDGFLTGWGPTRNPEGPNIFRGGEDRQSGQWFHAGSPKAYESAFTISGIRTIGDISK